jgi:3-phenylpropionate/trans-cinnamate dioxygenase ferredoxin reductase subunit
MAYFHPEARYTEQGIELLLGAEVTEVDPPAHRVRLRDGHSLAYDRLLLTVGGQARHLPAHGGDKALYLRTIEDARLIRARLSAARRVLCIGAGVIGLEIASSACAARRGVLEALPGAMGRGVSPEARGMSGVASRCGCNAQLRRHRRCDRGGRVGRRTRHVPRWDAICRRW